MTCKSGRVEFPSVGPERRYSPGRIDIGLTEKVSFKLFVELRGRQ